VLNSHRDALAATASTHAEQAAAKAHVSAFFEWMVREQTPLGVGGALSTAP